MAYISLYRKYRPQCFADVVGQDHVVQTLQNALRSGRIANGYLFCGTRGVAKTTIARIFAKCLNCIGPDGSRSTPTHEPCNECAACRAISAGQCVDVIEMDAASNRSVSDMAKVRENVQFGPMENRFKTYIVDEAHQLSSDAKDAFLKTLEEPPANVVFILATTESHAIPVTIASRCQQFDFKRGSLATISKQIRKVLDFESVSMQPDAVTIVARAAEGSYRDALSILEQVIAYKREDVTADDVIEVLGAVDASVTDRVVDLLSAKDAAGAFTLAEEIFIGGKDIRQFLKTMSGYLRDLLFSAVGARPIEEDPELAGESAAHIARQASLFTPSSLLRMLEILSEAERESKTANQQRLLLEMTLLRLMLQPAPAQMPAAAASSDTSATTSPQPRPVAERPAPTPVPRTERPTGLPPRATDRTNNGAPAVSRPAEPVQAPGAPAPAAHAAPVEPSAASTNSGATHQQLRAAEPVESTPIIAPVGRIDADNQLEYLSGHWQEVIHHFQAASPSGVKVIMDARPVEQTGKTFTVAFTQKAYVDLLESPKRKSFLEGILDKVLRADKGTYRVRIILAKQDAYVPVAPVPTTITEQQTEEADSGLLDDVIAIFGGKIIEDE